MCPLNEIIRASYTSTRALKVVDNLSSLTISLFLKESLLLIGIRIDNDNARGTRGDGDNKVKEAKQQLDIQWEANPPESPDLNPIETIWRIVKQRLKDRGLILDPTESRRAIEEEGDKITMEEINKAIATMPDRVSAEA